MRHYYRREGVREGVQEGVQEGQRTGGREYRREFKRDSVRGGRSVREGVQCHEGVQEGLLSGGRRYRRHFMREHEQNCLNERALNFDNLSEPMNGSRDRSPLGTQGTRLIAPHASMSEQAALACVPEASAMAARSSCYRAHGIYISGIQNRDPPCNNGIYISVMIAR